jgi:catechol 2,3-dioxygenase-like lactoylglutathione lyase family enzyme
MIIDHLGIAVSDYTTSKQFYTQCLAPLGIQLAKEVYGWGGFGRDGKPEFWFGPADKPHSPMHIAFSASSREQVDQFYQAALKAGATDNGAPGLRPEYHPHYYGAFVLDPDGHNIEAVCHKPE